jgi:hypothetical protein
MGTLLQFANLRSDLPAWSRVNGNVSTQLHGSFEHAITFTQGNLLHPLEGEILDEIARRITGARLSAHRGVEIEIIGFGLDDDANDESSAHAMARADAVAGELALRGVTTRGIEVRASDVASLKRSAVVRVIVRDLNEIAA